MTSILQDEQGCYFEGASLVGDRQYRLCQGKRGVFGGDVIQVYLHF